MNIMSFIVDWYEVVLWVVFIVVITLAAFIKTLISSIKEKIENRIIKKEREKYEKEHPFKAAIKDFFELN